MVTRRQEDFGIPAGVRDVVGRRLSRLSPEANEVLACAAVTGLEFEPRVVQAAGGFSEGTVIAAIEEATATRLVVDVPGPIPRNRFSHALVRATLYDELTGAGGSRCTAGWRRPSRPFTRPVSKITCRPGSSLGPGHRLRAEPAGRWSTPPGPATER